MTNAEKNATKPERERHLYHYRAWLFNKDLSDGPLTGVEEEFFTVKTNDWDVCAMAFARAARAMQPAEGQMIQLELCRKGPLPPFQSRS